MFHKIPFVANKQNTNAAKNQQPKITSIVFPAVVTGFMLLFRAIALKKNSPLAPSIVTASNAKNIFCKIILVFIVIKVLKEQ